MRLLYTHFLIDSLLSMHENIITAPFSDGLLSISGEGALKLLQGQLTCDLSEISETQTRLGAHCNPKGRMISFFRVIWFQNQYLLQMPRQLLPIALGALKKYAVFFKANLQDVSDQYKQIGFSDSQLSTLPNSLDEAVAANNFIVFKVPGSDERYEAIGTLDAILDLFNQISSRCKTTTEDDWKYLNMLAGIPRIFPETSEKFLPHELNLPQLKAISFKKGCYTGQEIVARMEYLGKVKNKLFLAQVETEMSPIRGADIYHDKRVAGTVVDFCHLGYNKYMILIITGEDSMNKTLSLTQEDLLPLSFHSKKAFF